MHVNLRTCYFWRTKNCVHVCTTLIERYANAEAAAICQFIYLTASVNYSELWQAYLLYAAVKQCLRPKARTELADSSPCWACKRGNGLYCPGFYKCGILQITGFPRIPYIGRAVHCSVEVILTHQKLLPFRFPDNFTGHFTAQDRFYDLWQIVDTSCSPQDRDER